MGNAAPIAIREGNKPLDASDITDLEQAKLEITRMRTTIHRLAPRKLPDLMDYGREWLAKYGGGYENESFLYETLDTIKQMQPAIEQIFTKHADDHPGQESDMSYEEFLLSLADLQAFTDAGTKFTAASEQEKQQMFNNLDADFNRVLNKAEYMLFVNILVLKYNLKEWTEVIERQRDERKKVADARVAAILAKSASSPTI